MPNALLRKAKQVAAKRGIPMRELLIEALQARLGGTKAEAFTLRDVAYGSRGRSVSSVDINAAIDEGREPSFRG